METRAVGHPCFDAGVAGGCGRVHLPVAAGCNIKCNYCNRRYDCVNESRPGVTSGLLEPRQAVAYLEEVLTRAPHITVAGIAGPGDAFADPHATLETMRLVRERFPELLLCLATNGLNIGPYVQDLAQMNVTHVTVTVNAVDPDVGAKIYAWVRDGKVIYRGLKAAELLLRKQLDAIAALKSHGIKVKVNTIVVPGVNDGHVSDVAVKMAELGADIHNCMSMYPNKGTPFESIPEPTAAQVSEIRSKAREYLPQMTHCTRCRADAVGLLGDDRSGEFRGCMADVVRDKYSKSPDKPYVAVGTMEGVLVNQHLGEAYRLQIWGKFDDGYHLVEERDAPEPGQGMERWQKLAEILHDCKALLVSGIGSNPNQVLLERAIVPVVMNGFIGMGLDAVFGNGNLAALAVRKTGGCSKGTGCGGDGGGCG